MIKNTLSVYNLEGASVEYLWGRVVAMVKEPKHHNVFWFGDFSNLFYSTKRTEYGMAIACKN